MAALWQGEEVAALLGSEVSDWRAEGVSIDSRTLKAGDLFIAIKGAQHDGASFVADALRKGAAAAISSAPSDLPNVISVADSHAALMTLAHAARQRAAQAKIAAVTGSVGKTGVKDALAFVLDAHAAEASFNNHLGVPLSLARMPQDARMAVFEIGMNHRGEISPLAQLVRPDLAIITCIAEVHMEFFDSLNAIAESKAEIFDGLRSGGAAILNRDDDFYDVLKARAAAKSAEVVSFGAHAKSDARLIDMRPKGSGAAVKAEVFGQPVAFSLAQSPRAHALNALAVLAAVAMMGGDVMRAASRLEAYRPRAGRGQRIALNIGGAAITLIDDSYNASPASMRVALEGLDNMAGGRRIAVLGDMHELGARSVELHRDLLEAVRAHADRVFACGAYMKHLYDLLPASLQGSFGDSAEALLPPLLAALRDGDVVMVKASKAAGFDRLVRKLKEAL